MPKGTSTGGAGGGRTTTTGGGGAAVATPPPTGAVLGTVAEQLEFQFPETTGATLGGKPATYVEGVNPTPGTHANIGASNDAFLVTYQNGERAVVKPVAGEHGNIARTMQGNQAWREVAMHNMNNVMGLKVVPPTQMVNYKGGVASAQQFKEGGTEARRAMIDNKALLQSARGRVQIGQMAALDYVFQNGDRHLGNWMINGQSKRLVAIDNGFAATNVRGAGWRGNFAPGKHQLRDIASMAGADYRNTPARSMLSGKVRNRVARLAAMPTERLAQALRRSVDRKMKGAVGPEANHFRGVALRIKELHQRIERGQPLPGGWRGPDNEVLQGRR